MSLDLDMGKYAAFVWPAWAISALVLGALAAWVVGKARAASKALAEAEGEDAP